MVEQPGYLNPVGRAVQRHALTEGVFLRPLGEVIYLLPPLCLEDRQLEHCYGAIQGALDRL